MTMLPPFDEATALRVAASRAALTGQLARWLVHELRGPVQVLTLMPDLLESGTDDATLRMLREGTDRMERATATLDEFLQRPPSAPTLEPIVLAPLLALLVRAGTAHRGDVTVHAGTILADVPAVAAVEGWLPHCAGALLVNAIEACGAHEEGTVRLAVTVDGPQVVLTVHDDGPGFPEGVAQAAFEGCSTRPYEGWPRGLGLPVARLLARAMGGDVVIAHNQPGDVRMALRLPAWGTHR